MVVWSVMKKISATKFKEQCLAILDEVDPGGIVITKHGRPVAQLFPVNADPHKIIGCMKGKIHIRGDIASTGIKWDVKS